MHQTDTPRNTRSSRYRADASYRALVDAAATTARVYGQDATTITHLAQRDYVPVITDAAQFQADVQHDLDTISVIR